MSLQGSDPRRGADAVARTILSSGILSVANKVGRRAWARQEVRHSLRRLVAGVALHILPTNGLAHRVAGGLQHDRVAIDCLVVSGPRNRGGQSLNSCCVTAFSSPKYNK